ncbi:thioesterase family protein [Pelagicoccus sp. SDUM812002]|uniref:acyl-CoA thioesterase n=1 Tax=Pelagicoccus sp. SDUM812002 TaxID=3041266 RepID=UPI00280DF842|nr:thioesterase family protein [Pelagicoccus sp. SDUM812002]MDQ8185118.1 thioesterase family protein [Pelagicoccus sp. SDUM812002]
MNEQGIFSQRIGVSKAHIDVNGHVNNVVYIQWMQDIAYSHSKAVGYDSSRLDELGSTWVIRSHFVKYQRPALLGDQLIVYTWPHEIKKASALRRYKFVRATDHVTIASGESDWVYIDRNTGRPQPIDDSMRAAFPEVAEKDEP